MLNIILSLVLGAGLDSLYYTLFILKCKNISKNKILLFIVVFVSYILLFMIIRYNMYLYLIFYIIIYISLKIIYKAQIIDYFVLIISGIYYLLISILCYYIIPLYGIALIINKILLFLPIILNNKLNKIYLIYNNMWNRNYNIKMPIKSLTLRNISLVIFNSFIVINYIILLNLCS